MLPPPTRPTSGYWQFEDYFADQEDAIRDAFAFRAPEGDHARIGGDRGRPSVIGPRSAHRLHAAPRRLGFLGVDYYRRAVERDRRSRWTESACSASRTTQRGAEELRLRLPDDGRRPASPDDRAWEDMLLIARCDHHVISNSTFSWWGRG